MSRGGKCTAKGGASTESGAMSVGAAHAVQKIAWRQRHPLRVTKESTKALESSSRCRQVSNGKQWQLKCKSLDSGALVAA